MQLRMSLNMGRLCSKKAFFGQSSFIHVWCQTSRRHDDDKRKRAIRMFEARAVCLPRAPVAQCKHNSNRRYEPHR